MKTLKIIDRAFAHCEYSNNPLPPTSFSKYIKWDRNIGKTEDLVFYTDSNIKNPYPGHKRKIAWLIEPYIKQPDVYEWIYKNNSTYDYVLTNEKKLLNKGENFIFFPFGGCWIQQQNRKFHNKTKTVSIIVSKKRNVPDHNKRHELISLYGDKIDVYGRGYVPIEPIDLGLVDYMYHIAMENQSRDYHFSEKIMNPIMCGTIPIYYGMPTISNFFDTRGMIIFNDISELNDILPRLNLELYNSMLPYAKINFEKAKQYILSEDWMYENVFNKIGIPV
jgi:hypothetical protein